MTQHRCGIAAGILLLVIATSGWCQQFYLYTPKPAAPEEKLQPGAGVIVQEVQVQKGDTLYGLSRRFSGHGSYYPQILLFNDIKDPDKIYAGDTLKLPVRTDQAPVRKAPPAAPVVKRAADAVPAASRPEQAPSKQAKAAKQQAADADTQSGQKLFERAVKAYRQEECSVALELFDRFLAENSASPLAADADLYKADCYLKQSSQ